MTTTKYRIDRRAALKLIGGASLVAVPGGRVGAQTLDKVSYQTNWRAQGEHGGFRLGGIHEGRAGQRGGRRHDPARQPRHRPGGLALIGAVVAEFVAGSGGTASGLAFHILESGYQLRIPRMFAALFLISASGIAIFLVTSWIAHRALRRWHESAIRRED